MKRKRFLLLVPIVLFMAILGVRLLLDRDTETVQEQLTTVIASYPETGLIEESLQYPGTLLPAKTVTVLPKTHGKIERIFVREGERVEANQQVASLDTDVAELQLAQAKAGYEAAIAQYQKALKGVRKEEIENTRALITQAEKELETAKTNLARAQRLFEAGAMPRAELEDAENQVSSGETKFENAKRSLKLMEQGASDEELDMARSNMEAAEAQYELAKLQYENAQIMAPASGLVAKIMVDEGNMAGPSVPLLAIVEDETILAEVKLPEKYYGRMMDQGLGIVARIYPIAFPEDTGFSGTVTNISPIIDATSRTFTLEITINNDSFQLRPGMYVNVELIVDRIENALLVPESSLVFRDDTNVVFVTEGDSTFKASMRPVSVGLRKNGAAEIIRGLTPNDRIIIHGNAFLEDGQRVRVVDG